MKKITIELTNEQSEFFEHVSNLCAKDTSDFIKEALICLLPLNEYVAAKKDLVVLENNNMSDNLNDINYMEMKKRFQDINTSTSNRLKTIGVI